MNFLVYLFAVLIFFLPAGGRTGKSDASVEHAGDSFFYIYGVETATTPDELLEALVTNFDTKAFTAFLAGAVARADSPVFVANHTALDVEARPGGSLFQRMFDRDSLDALLRRENVCVHLVHRDHNVTFRLRLAEASTVSSTSDSDPMHPCINIT